MELTGQNRSWSTGARRSTFTDVNYINQTQQKMGECKCTKKQPATGYPLDDLIFKEKLERYSKIIYRQGNF